MRHTLKSLRTCIVIALLCSFVGAQSTNSAQSAVVPQLVKFSGKAVDEQGKPVSGIVALTFAIYSAQQGGSPSWTETQSVNADAKGNYTVQLGSTQAEGLPLELFSSGGARWVGVRVNGEDEQPRVLLLSVPYALKAADAQTLGGLPASAFVLAAPPNSNTPVAGSPTPNPAGDGAPAITGGGKPKYIPIWTTASKLGNSALFQSGKGGTAQVGIGTTTPASTLDVNGTGTVRGLFSLPATGTATSSGGFNSQPTNQVASVFNSSAQTAVPQTFQWQAEPVNNNMSNATGSLNLLFAQGSGKPAETGLNIASNGQINFANGQTFPGTGTITGVTAGADLTGGGSSGQVTLNLDITKVPLLGAVNTFTANQTVTGTVTATAFSGNGSALTNVNAASLNGLTSSAFSQTLASNTYQSSPLGTALPQVLAPVNNATASGGFNSNPLDLASSSYNSGAGAAQKETYRWQAEPVGNNTNAPSGTLNLLFGANGAAPAETGLNIASNGQITFASGQMYPGAGTITGVTAGTGLTGGGNSGNVTLSMLTSCSIGQVLQWSGSQWVCAAPVTGTVTSVGLGAPGSDFTVSGSPITSSGTLGLSWTVAPTNTDTANSIVKRDASGNFSADVITSDGGVIGSAGSDTTYPAGVYGQDQEFGTYGVLGQENGTYGQGVWGESFGTNCDANGNCPDGVHGVAGSPAGSGVAGLGGGYGVYGQTGYYAGVYGYNSGNGDGVEGISQSGSGVYGAGALDGVFAVSTGQNSGVVAQSSGKGWAVNAYGSSGATGVLAGSDTGYAAWFNGNVDVDGRLSKAGGSFKIDHPLDPANKYLYHSFVESPDMMNIYNGNVTTDAQGDAVVHLPEWFEALNRDFRYQLTVIGQFAQAIVATEMAEGRFSIKTDKPNVKVSWQVTGIRQDAWANANRIPVEEEKPEVERGFYLHPKLYGAPEEKGILWATAPRAMQQWKEAREHPPVIPAPRSDPARNMSASPRRHGPSHVPLQGQPRPTTIDPSSKK